MNEYTVRLLDGRLITAYGFTHADIPTAVEAEDGIDREEIKSIQLIAKRSSGARGQRPYAELLQVA